MAILWVLLGLAIAPMNPEFKHGDSVTYYSGGVMFRGFVFHIYQVRGEPRYVLMEDPEGKPISAHKTLHCSEHQIMQSRLFPGVTNYSFNYDKEKKPACVRWAIHCARLMSADGFSGYASALPTGIVKVTAAEVKADPALEAALRELPWLRLK